MQEHPGEELEGAVDEREDDALFVNLFIPANVHWREKGLTITQDTAFPEADTTTLVVDAAAPVDFSLRVRHAGWAKGLLQASVNGGPATPLTDGSGAYATLSRTWRSGDRVTITLPMSLRVEPLLCVVGARDRHRRFDIWVEGARIEPPELDGQVPGLVRTIRVPIPADLCRDKSAITVRFQARDEWDATSANVFECLLVPGSWGCPP